MNGASQSGCLGFVVPRLVSSIPFMCDKSVSL